MLHEVVAAAARSASARDQPVIFRAHITAVGGTRGKGGKPTRKARRGRVGSIQQSILSHNERRGVGACARGNGGSGTPSVNARSFSVDGCWSANTTVCMLDCVCIMSGRQADGQAGIGEDALEPVTVVE